MSGKFIVIEGMDGAGKTTLQKGLEESLGHEYEVLCVRDPGCTKTAERLRELALFGEEGESLEALSELAVFMSARHELTEKIVRPALEAGKVVICDRYQMSTDAYQGAGLGLSEEVGLTKELFNPITPDLTILLDLDYETAMRRAGSRTSDKKDLIEARGEAFFTRVRNHFRTQVVQNNDVVLLDATDAPDVLIATSVSILEEHYFL